MIIYTKVKGGTIIKLDYSEISLTKPLKYHIFRVNNSETLTNTANYIGINIKIYDKLQKI